MVHKQEEKVVSSLATILSRRWQINDHTRWMRIRYKAQYYIYRDWGEEKDTVEQFLDNPV